MNSWLDTLGPAARACNPDWRDGCRDAWHFPGPFRQPAINYGRAVFHWSDIVHDHAPIRAYAPPGTFCFTMLRDPGRRLVSQFADWRGLTAADTAVHNEALGCAILDTQHLTLTEFLARHGEGAVRPLVDNYLTRALAASRLGERALGVEDSGRLLGDALHVLHTDYDFVGLTEAFDLSRNGLCAMLGLPPCGPAEMLNRSTPAGARDTDLLLSDADAWRFTRHDRVLYDAARRLFDTRYRAQAESYSATMFEQRHAAALLGQLRAVYAAGATKHSVSDPFHGTGLHQRDGGVTGPHAVWTMSGLRAAIYIPVPAGMPLSLLLWVRGYAHPVQRAALRVWVDGREAVPGFERADGYEEVMVIAHMPAAGFARLEVEVPHCQMACQDDARPRGVSFDAYGWRPIHLDTVAARPSPLSSDADAAPECLGLVSDGVPCSQGSH